MFLFRTSSLWCWKHYYGTAACHRGAFRSIYVLLHCYFLTASKELRVNFPESKNLEALRKAGRLSRVSWKITRKKGSWTMSKVEILMQLKIQVAQPIARHPTGHSCLSIQFFSIQEGKNLWYALVRLLCLWRIAKIYFDTRYARVLGSEVFSHMT